MVARPVRYGMLVGGLAAALLAFGGMACLATGEVQTGGALPSPESTTIGTAPGAVASPTTAPVPAAPVTVEARVTRVIDGSTLDAIVGGVRTGVGYIGASTPPGNTPCGRAATARNAELAGSAVRLETDSAYEHDAAGRALYYAYTMDGDLIEAVLVREGLARAAGGNGRRGAELTAVEAEARAAGTGCIWSEARPA
jgi:endonuclease YncB( thermonuclease family)